MAKCTEHPLNVPIVEQKLTSGIRVHGLLLSLSTSATIVACCLTAWHVFQHARHYTKRSEQKQIIRILLMVPIYTIACILSIEFYKQHVYLASIYEFYESLVIAAFFLLLCQLLHPDPTTLRRAFSLVEPKPWIHPICFLVTIWFCVFQFCIVKFLGALVKCMTEAADVYCEESSSASHAKIWVMVIEILSLVTAMMCVLQFYQQTKKELETHQPLLKFLAINFLMQEDGPIKPTPTISYPSWAVGIPNTILCFVMAAVSILHIFAYPYEPYRARIDTKDDSRSNDSAVRENDQHPLHQVLVTRSHDGWSRQHDESVWDGTQSSPDTRAPAAGFKRKALVDALNFVEVVFAVVTASRWLVAERRKDAARAAAALEDGRDYPYGAGDVRRQKTGDLSQALDRAQAQTSSTRLG
ncbi:Transmembrane protein 184-like protein [Colletotrichum aenigma]|uniref:Transmembrane protein 184-like protein n=1 Tax=Colletotrichum aenigma TaxID=1215731 RepID=UPI0018733489|nr:Transmembrane protein 184-like protein [Colletotrichum aenigma]KAF5527444.1 Transmembrane protein 184-like protein [Colletotrichum aenigma]